MSSQEKTERNREMLSLRKQGAKTTFLAYKYGISQPRVTRILNKYKLI